MNISMLTLASIVTHKRSTIVNSSEIKAGSVSRDAAGSGDVQPPLMKSGAPIPPGQKAPLKLTVFLLHVKKWVCKKLHWLEPNEFFMIINQFQLCALYILQYASGANNSPASGLMKTSSPEVSAAPNTCRSSVPQLRYTLTVWHERYKNAIWGAAKSIMWCVIGGRDRNTTSSHTFRPWPL